VSGWIISQESRPIQLNLHLFTWSAFLTPGKNTNCPGANHISKEEAKNIAIRKQQLVLHFRSLDLTFTFNKKKAWSK
jgi:hypothetical protein